VSSLSERTRDRREVAQGREGRKFDCFATYVNDVKSMSVIARRTTAFHDLHGRSPDKLEPAVGGPLLAEAESRRSMSLERLRLLSDTDTILAANRLNEAVWSMEWIARGRIGEVAPEHWQRAQREFEVAFDAFHRCARRGLGVPGRLVLRQAGPLPGLEALQREPVAGGPEP
jgi:hypothetical protein